MLRNKVVLVAMFQVLMVYTLTDETLLIVCFLFEVKRIRL